MAHLEPGYRDAFRSLAILEQLSFLTLQGSSYGSEGITIFTLKKKKKRNLGPESILEK